MIQLKQKLHLFFRRESSGGIVMILFAAFAIIAANSPLSGFYLQVAAEPVRHFVNDVMMVFFFLLIGLELKREMCEGFLAQRSQILLPLVAAAGGMIAPAVIFFLFNQNSPETISGWAIPCATDIAFAVVVLSLLGKNIPSSIKIFLLAIAIFDDLGAIIIIAAFYNTGLAALPLILSAILIAALFVINRKKVMSVIPYLVIGALLWVCFFYSGIHTTLAGVIAGVAIPQRPIDKLIHLLHPWVSFLVLPIFALVNAGVDMRAINISDLLHPLPLGIAMGLLLGKQIGIFGASYLVIKSGFAKLPEGSSWNHVYAVSVIAGIGFTMSLFIGMLAFSTPEMLELVKVGVIAGSLLCVVWAGLVLRIIR